MSDTKKRFTVDQLLSRGYLIEQDSVYVPAPGMMVGAWTNGGDLLTFSEVAPVEDEILERAGLEFISVQAYSPFLPSSYTDSQWVPRDDVMFVVYKRVDE